MANGGRVSPDALRAPVHSVPVVVSVRGDARCTVTAAPSCGAAHHIAGTYGSSSTGVRFSRVPIQVDTVHSIADDACVTLPLLLASLRRSTLPVDHHRSCGAGLVPSPAPGIIQG